MKTSNSETPIQFAFSKIDQKNRLEYIETREICQGGPIVGQIILNNKQLKGTFGGPALFNENYLIIPLFIRNMFGSGFRLALINLSNFNISIFKGFEDLIYLDEVANDKVNFFTDLNKNHKKQYDIDFIEKE